MQARMASIAVIKPDAVTALSALSTSAKNAANRPQRAPPRGTLLAALDGLGEEGHWLLDGLDDSRCLCLGCVWARPCRA